MKIRLWVAISSSVLFSACNLFYKKANFVVDIAPIIHENCSPCHHKYGAGPFELITYDQISAKAKTIVAVTSIRYMPPWPANPHKLHFKNEKILSDKQINIIKKWVLQGKIKGDLTKLKYPNIKNYTVLGKPDMVIKLPKIKLKGDGKDRFLIIKLPVTLSNDTFLRSIVFVPDQKQTIHHVNGYILNYQQVNDDFFKDAKPVDIESPDFEQELSKLNLFLKGMPLPSRIHSAFNYLPGVFGNSYPEGIGGFKVKKHFALVCNDIHFGPVFKDTFDQSEIHLFFAKKAPERQTLELMLGTNGIAAIIPPLVLPPNKITKVQSSFYLPKSISVLTVNPHMHLLGKSCKAFAFKGKDTIEMISINQWDFRWQYFYTYKQMLKIPAGYTIKVEAVYDNTELNSNNPFSPPKQISERLNLHGAGMKTTDEMLQFIITYLPYQLGDEKIKL